MIDFSYGTKKNPLRMGRGGWLNGFSEFNENGSRTKKSDLVDSHTRNHNHNRVKLDNNRGVGKLEVVVARNISDNNHIRPRGLRC